MSRLDKTPVFLKKAVRYMILGGLATELICKIQEVPPEYVVRIRKEPRE